MYEVEELPAMPWRRRLLMLTCALGMVYLIMSHVMARPGNADYKPPPLPDKAQCAPGQNTGCVGGLAAVIAAPMSSPVRASSAPVSASAGN